MDMSKVDMSRVDMRFMVSMEQWEQAEELEHITVQYWNKWQKKMILLPSYKERSKVLDKFLIYQSDPQKIAEMMEMSPVEILETVS